MEAGHEFLSNLHRK